MSLTATSETSLFDICNERCQSGPDAAECLLDSMLAHESFSLAYHLYSLGFSLLPLNGKRPCRKWKPLQTERVDLLTLVEWFYDREFWPGIITGELSGIVAYDCDDEESLRAAEALLPETSMRQSTRRGCHLIYRHPGDRCPNRQRINGSRIDFRGDGGYIVAYEDSRRWRAEELADYPELDGFAI